MMTVTPVTFTRRHDYGDFAWMIQQPQYAHDVFVFNDNAEAWIAWRYGGAYQDREPGAGNAVIRPYRLRTDRVFGVPTGTRANGGWSDDDFEDHPITKHLIDEAIEAIADRIEQGDIGQPVRVFYSAGPDGVTLGCGVFTVGPAVLSYITHRLATVPRAARDAEENSCASPP